MTNCLTTKDAKYTNEEIQKRTERAQRIIFCLSGDDDKQKHSSN